MSFIALITGPCPRIRHSAVYAVPGRVYVNAVVNRVLTAGSFGA